MSEFENLSPENAEYVLNLPYHLAAGDMADDLCELLTEFEFLSHKVSTLDPQQLIEDYELTASFNISLSQETKSCLQLLKEAIRLAAHVLSKDATQLAGQLLGRLLQFTDSPKIQHLLESAQQYQDTSWLRPLTVSLISPNEPLIRTLIGHESSVLSLAVTYDNQKLISGSQDGNVKIWHLKSGYLAHTITAHNDSVNVVVVSNDGLYIFSGSNDKTIKIWDLNTGELLRTLVGHTGSINAVVLTPDCSKIISASSDCSLKVWNLKNGEVLDTFLGHSASVEAVTIVTASNQYFVISGSYNDTPKVWDLKTGKEEFSLGESDMIWSTIAIPNKELVIFGSQDGTITIWCVKTWKRQHSFKAHNNSVRAISVTSDGERIISASEDKTLKIWKVSTWESEATINAHTGSVLAIAKTSDGQKIVSGSGGTIMNFISKDYTIKMWDMERCVLNQLFDTECTKISHADSVELVFFSRDGKQVISTSKDGTRKFWKVGTWENEKTLIGNVNSAFTFGDKQNRKIITLKFGDVKETVDSTRATLPFLLASTPDGQLQILSSGDEAIKVWDDCAKKMIACFTGESEIKCCAIAPDEQTIAVGEASGRLHFLQLCSEEF
jgi:WD40 repeat protein